MLGHWLKLIRWPNLLMVALAQVLFKYVFLPYFKISPTVEVFDFWLLCFSVLFVAACGYIINDIYDIKTDFINKRSRPLAIKKISTAKAYSVYIIFNVLAILFAIYLSYKWQSYELTFMVTSVVVLLFLYAKKIKSIPILGNVLVSFLVSLSFLLVLYFELILNKSAIISIDLKYHIIGYSAFAFWTNLNRELIKDVLDIKGDYAQKISTLPILLGKTRINYLIFGSTLLLIFSLIAGVKVYFQPDLIFILYLTFGICLPLVYVLFHIYKKELKTDYRLLSHLYKVVMLLGVLSLVLFQL